ncbi:MAG TPA: cytochrome c biogenesis protein CcsA [Spirochaetota bacterium]
MLKVLPVILFAVLSCAALYLGLFVTPPAEGLGASSALFYLHVPLALCATVSFCISGWHAFRFLAIRETGHAESSHIAARLGLLFTVLTTATGALWARLAWGSFWNNDPRESSIVFLLIVYAAYFALRNSLGERADAPKICAVYLLFSAAVMPFFVFVVPRIYPSLHPDTIINGSRKVLLTAEMRMTLLLAGLAALSFFAALFGFEKRIALLARTDGDTK